MATLFKGICGIYKITSPSGRVYIGQSKNIGLRRLAYRSIKREGQPRIAASIKKYGLNVHQFDVIHELPKDVDQFVLNEYELLYISQYKNCGFMMMNCKATHVLGGHSEESKIKMSLSRKGRKPSEETKQKMAEPQKGRKRAEGTGAKISAALKGKKFSQERRDRAKVAHKGKHSMSEENKEKQRQRKGSLSPSFGKKVSEETKRKISTKNKGRIMSDEEKKRRSDALKGKGCGKYQRSPEQIERMRAIRLGKKLSPEHAAKLKASRKGVPMKPENVLKAVQARLKNGSYKKSAYVQNFSQ